MARSSAALCLVVLAGSAAVLGAPRAAAAQVEVDRTLSRIGTAIITASDVEQARRVKLVKDTSSDEATLRALEDRLLILQEASRGAQSEISEDAIAARRGQLDAAGIKASGMSDQAVTSWCRDDVRIQMYMDRRFATLGGAERDRAINEWIGRLRQRAGLRTP